MKPLLLGFFLLFVNITFPQLGLYGALQVASNKVIALQDQPLYFFNGVIGSEGEDAQLLFLGSAQALNANEDAYSEIEVSIAAQDNFIFPLGNQGRYLPPSIKRGKYDRFTSTTQDRTPAKPVPCNWDRSIDSQPSLAA